MSNIDLVIVGSIGLDTIQTPSTKRESLLGGSTSYACAAASFFARPGMVGVVGTDFPENYRKLYENFNIDMAGLQVEEGKTFAWSGVYEDNMDNRSTISTDLNVFEHFSPDLPDHYCDVPYILLGNIAPALQLHVLDQIRSPKFVMADTMDLWINIAKEDLLKVIGRVDMLTINESEAVLLSGEKNLVKASEHLLSLGPKYVLIKKGENGSMLFSRECDPFMLHAFPVPHVEDPTGAGDTFAGALMGYLAAENDISEASLRRAKVRGTVIASFGVEAFSMDRLATLQKEELHGRIDSFLKMIDVPA